MSIGQDYDEELLKRQVRLADQARPWRSQYVDNTPAPSIQWMSGVTMREGEGIDRHYTVTVRPPFLLTRDQLHAYEQYGEHLAEALADIVPAIVLRVDSRIIITGTFGGGHRPRDIQPR